MLLTFSARCATMKVWVQSHIVLYGWYPPLLCKEDELCTGLIFDVFCPARGDDLANIDKERRRVHRDKHDAWF